MRFNMRVLAEAVVLMAAVVQLALGQGMDSYRLITTLMSNYSKEVRPAESSSSSIIVRYGIALRQIIDMDERNQILTTNVWLRQHWNDATLRWDPDEYDGISTVSLPSQDIWKPDVILYNIADDSVEGTMKTKAIITSDGGVTWYAPAIFKSSCKVNMKYFPFDKQYCRLQFGSWAFTTEHLDLVNRSVAGDTLSFIPNGEWELQGMPVVRHLYEYACCAYPFSVLEFTIIIRRRALFYVINMIVPCILVSALILLGFYLPADAAEKITLCITILLSLTVFLLLAAETMPPQSEVIPLIAQYYLCTIVLVSLSTFMTAIVIYTHHQGLRGLRPPPWLRSLAHDYLAKLMCMQSFQSDAKGMKQIPRINFDNTEEKSTIKGRDGQNGNALELGNVASKQDGVGSQARNNYLQYTLDQIAHYMQKIVERSEGEDVDEELVNEWVRIAFVIDRLFMWVFGVVTMVSTCSIILQVRDQ